MNVLYLLLNSAEKKYAKKSVLKHFNLLGTHLTTIFIFGLFAPVKGNCLYSVICMLVLRKSPPDHVCSCVAVRISDDFEVTWSTYQSGFSGHYYLWSHAWIFRKTFYIPGSDLKPGNFQSIRCNKFLKYFM